MQQGQPVPVLRLTALSLPQGGLFDFKTEWRPPHVSHRLGDDADILTPPLTNRQKAVLKGAYRNAGFSTPVPAESPPTPARRIGT